DREDPLELPGAERHARRPFEADRRAEAEEEPGRAGEGGQDPVDRGPEEVDQQEIGRERVKARGQRARRGQKAVAVAAVALDRDLFDLGDRARHWKGEGRAEDPEAAAEAGAQEPAPDRESAHEMA